ncbi:MAG: hypothetical protein LBB57_02910, partial [Clostridiales Family XIII bacterium]|nr:hypothetical protein [Clostridiales Family XIII bacterium]
GTLRGVAAFFMELFKFAVIFLPVIVLIAVIALAVFFIVKRLRSRAEKRGEWPCGKRLGKPGDAGRGKEAAAPEAPKQSEDAKQAPERDGAD